MTLYNEELNGLLLDRCVAYAKAHKHPERADQTIWQAFEAERTHLVPIAGRFDGFHAITAAVSKTCLVRFDNNKYSVSSRAVGRPVEVQAYADRIVLRQDGVIVGEHARCFGQSVAPQSPTDGNRDRRRAWQDGVSIWCRTGNCGGSPATCCMPDLRSGWTSARPSRRRMGMLHGSTRGVLPSVRFTGPAIANFS